MKMSLLFVAAVLCCGDQTSAEQIWLANRGSFELHTTQAETVIYRGRHALKLTEKPVGSGQLLAILRGHPFRNGTIDVDVAGARADGCRVRPRVHRDRVSRAIRRSTL